MDVSAQDVLRGYGVKEPGKPVRSMQLSADRSRAGSLPYGCARRARTREQGMALVIVGHAIEYLLDSRAASEQDRFSTEVDALTILEQASRAAYQEGKEIVPFSSRLRRLIPRISARRRGPWTRQPSH